MPLDFLIIFLLIFTPIAFGTVDPWAIAILEITTILSFILLLVKILVKKETTPFKGYLFLFILIPAFIQLIPISNKFIDVISPKTIELYNNFYMNLNKNSIISIINICFFAAKREIAKILSYVMIFIIVRTCFGNYRKIKKFTNIIVFTGFTVSFLSILQSIMGNGKLLWVRPLAEGRFPVGPYVNHNHFAGYVGMAAPLALGMQLISRRKEKKLLYGFMFICMCITIILSLSRGGVLSLIGAICIMSILLHFNKNTRNRLWSLLSVIMLIALGVIWLGLDPLIDRFSAWHADSDVRMNIWKDTFGIIKDFPFLGTGLGTFQYIYPKYKTIKSFLLFDHAHNDYLEYLSEMGLIGGLLALFALVFCFIRIFKRVVSTGDKNIAILLITGVTGIISILFHSITDFNLHIPANALLFVVIIALTMNIAEYKGEGHRKDATKKGYLFKIFRLPVFVIIVSLMLYYAKYAFCNYYAERQYNLYKNSGNCKNVYLLEEAIKRGPENAQYHYELAKFLLTVKSDDANLNSFNEYQKAIDLNFTNAYHHFGLAKYYIKNMEDRYNYEHIVNELKKTVRLDPSNYYFHKFLAHFAVYVIKGLEDSVVKDELLQLAVKEFNEAIILEPLQIDDAVETFFSASKDYNKLKLMIPSEVKEKPFIIAKSLIDNAVWTVNKKQYMRDFKRGINNYYYYKGISYSYNAMGDYVKEIKVLENYIKTDPDNLEAHEYLVEQASRHRDIFIPEYIKRHKNEITRLQNLEQRESE